MKKLIQLALLLCIAPFAHAQLSPISGFCVQGAVKAVTSGLASSNTMQGLIPSCTITVYISGTTTKATIYSDSRGDPLTNSFTATLSGQWIFYADIGQGYDVVLSGGIAPNVYASPVTLSDEIPSLEVPVPISEGGTGATTAPSALSNLGALPLAGGTMTGNLILNGAPTTSLQAANKGYVDSALGGYCSLSGCTMTGTLITPAVIATDVNGINSLLYDTNPRSPLSGWLFSATESGNQFIDVDIFGDSQSICDYFITSCLTGPTLDTNRWVDQLRLALGATGSGFVPVMAGVTNTVVNNQFWSISGAITKSTILGPSQSSSYATGSSLIQMSNGEVLTFQPTSQAGIPIQYNHFSVMCATTSGSGSITVDFDGTPAGIACGTPTSNPTPNIATFSTSVIANHAVHLTSTGTSYVYAGDAETGTTGFRVNNYATASAAAEYFGNAPSTQMAFSNIESHQLSIIDLGTNDANQNFGYSSTSYANAIQAILNNEITNAGAPSVVIVQPPVSNVATTGVWATYTAALTGVVNANTVGYVNIQSQWGTTYKSTYFCSDGIHPCDPGSLTESQMINSYVLPQQQGLPVSLTAQSIILQPSGPIKNPFLLATCVGICDTGITFQPFGETEYQLAEWGPGNSSGLSGVVGLIDQSTSIFPWSVDSADGICFGTPVSGGNVTSCAGAGFHYVPSTNTLGLNALTLNTLKLGSAGTTIHGIFASQGTLTFTSISAGGQQTQTMTVTGAVVANNGVTCSPQSVISGSSGLLWNSSVLSPNTVSVEISNISASPITPNAVPWGCYVVQ